LGERGLEAKGMGAANTPQLGYEQAAAHCLSELSGLVVGSDEVAFGVLKYCQERAIAVPNNLALVSIDNIALSAFANPSLTTIAVPQKAIGERAIQMLIGPNKDAPESIMLPTELIIRESCGFKVA
jgi:LacI family transcriptional regulator